jgi:hypothetical protein
MVSVSLQASDLEIRKLQKKLEQTDDRQQQMMAFLAKVVQNPAFLQQVLAARQPTQQRITGKWHSPSVDAKSHQWVKAQS